MNDGDHPAIEVPAPAKVNLYLHVTGRDDREYHLLQSLVVFTDFGDTIHVSVGTEPGPIHLSLTGPFAHLIEGPAEDNLVWRAADGVRHLLGTDRTLRITLQKNLPVAAGIGGGSADAAAAIRGVAQALGANLTERDQFDLAARLGADVLACLAGRPLYMQGIGEKVRPTGIPHGFGIVLVNPNQPVATPDIFHRFRQHGAFTAEENTCPDTTDRSTWLAELESRHNDLEKPAIDLCPAIDEVLAVLKAEPDILLSRMSGSGATCFGLCADPQTAHQLAERLSSEHPWWCRGGGLIT